jgi:CheY-specific phosphatase CheX
MPDPSYNELAQLYGLDPVPESVLRLTQLVARQNADLDEIANIISADPAISQRLLRTANPRAATEKDYEITTVEDALRHNGLGCVLLLAMGTPLSLALMKTFKTMLGLKLDGVNPKTVRPFLSEHVLGTINFSGKATGWVYLRLSIEGAQLIAARVLGVGPEELKDRSEVDDAVGELLNIVAGNFKSHLCDAGLDSTLHTPIVTRTTRFTIDTPQGAGLEHMAFTAPDLKLFVDVMVNPWTQG